MDIIRIDYCSLILPDVGAQFCVIAILNHGSWINAKLVPYHLILAIIITLCLVRISSVKQ